LLVAILSDIHSNLNALNSVLEYINNKNINLIICAGDLVGYYLKPNEVISKLKQYDLYCIKGNHDDAVFHSPKNFNSLALQSLKYNIEILSSENKAFLKMLKSKKIFKIDNKRILLVHGSLTDNLNDYLFSEDIDDTFYQTNHLNKFDVVIFGQTHHPYIKKFKSTLIINPGSVGQPRDGDWRTSFVIYNTKTHQAEIIRLEYDVEKTVKEAKQLLDLKTAERLYEGI